MDDYLSLRKEFGACNHSCRSTRLNDVQAAPHIRFQQAAAVRRLALELWLNLDTTAAPNQALSPGRATSIFAITTDPSED
jgi:hypothetical protein